MRLIELSGVGFSYSPGSRILSDVNLRLDRGESLALTGPSGSGKTTLLGIIGGLLAPSTGDMSPDTSSGSLRIGWIFQSINTLGRRTALDNVALGALSTGCDWGQAKQHAAELLVAVGLGQQSHQRSRFLSGGELQRVVIARALAAQPDLLLADEPTGQLDEANSDLVMSTLLGLMSSGASLIVATHDLSLAARCNQEYRVSHRSEST